MEKNTPCLGKVRREPTLSHVGPRAKGKTKDREKKKKKKVKNWGGERESRKFATSGKKGGQDGKNLTKKGSQGKKYSGGEKKINYNPCVLIRQSRDWMQLKGESVVLWEIKGSVGKKRGTKGVS